MYSWRDQRSQEMAKISGQAMEDGVLPSYHVYTISKLGRKITGYFNGCKRFFTKAIQEQKKPFGYQHVRSLR